MADQSKWPLRESAELTDAERREAQRARDYLMKAFEQAIDKRGSEAKPIGVQPMAWALAHMAGTMLGAVPPEHRLVALAAAIELLSEGAGLTIDRPKSPKLDA